MNEAIRTALVEIGLRLHGQHGIGPTGKQWDANRPQGAPMARALNMRTLGIREKEFGVESWNDMLTLAGLRYPPKLLARARHKAQSADPNFTGEDVEFIYGRAVDSVLHTRPFVEQRIWWQRGRRWITVEVAQVVSGERLRPLPGVINVSA